MIKAIETRYAGCHFRSRLEARWAVFFDALGIPWEYEPQGFEGCHGTNYLPDFYLPETSVDYQEPGLYVEVKGSDEQLRQDSDKIGEAIDYWSTPIAKGLLILGDVPRVTPDVMLVSHSVLSWRKGVQHSLKSWERNFRSGRELWNLSGYAPNHPLDAFDDNTTEAIPDEASTHAVMWHRVSFTRGGKRLAWPRNRNLDAVASAYNAARSARFEHGQSGAT